MSTRDWRQYNIHFPDRGTAQQVAAHDVAPALTEAQDAGLLHLWWFVRKRPWRLRYLPDDARATSIAELLDELAADGRIVDWSTGIYEPETLAFGGPAAMDVAHELFHLDSRYLLTRAASPHPSSLRQRESTVVLCSVLLRAAGLDFYEQGDVWAKVAELRPVNPATATAPARANSLVQAMHRLMTVDARALCDPAEDGPLTGYDEWIIAFEKAGQALADLARQGRLERGLRAVLAHHVIFHANRAGLPVTDQAALAALAVRDVFHPGQESASPSATTIDTSSSTSLGL
jgi:protein-L-isoaspartate(D-aspartate) O-methyltransferase